MSRPPGEPSSSVPNPRQGTADIPSDLNRSLHSTIGSVLDFILETFACSPEDKVTTASINSDSQSVRSNAFFRDSQNIKLSLSNAIRPSVFSHADDKDEDVAMMEIDDLDAPADEAKSSSSSEMYACILWNDESHSYPQVIDQLVSAAGCTEAQAKETAENVNQYVSCLIVCFATTGIQCYDINAGIFREEILSNYPPMWTSFSI
jgi:E3 ubiquitin-protein ligase UBR1